MRGLSYTKTQDTHWPPPTNPGPPLGGHRSCGEWHWGSQVHAHLREHGKPLPPLRSPSTLPSQSRRTWTRKWAVGPGDGPGEGGTS